MGKENARGSLDVLDKAIHYVSGQRAELGAVQNRLTSTSQNLQVSSENLEAANSRIRDTDFAQETANNTKLNILNNVGTSVLGQANASGQAPQRLIS
jgi:flagellin